MQAVKNFRINVRVAMARAKLSQGALAEKAEVSRPYLNRILKEKQDPSLDVCDRIADALKMPIGDLVASPRKFLKILPRAIA